MEPNPLSPKDFCNTEDNDTKEEPNYMEIDIPYNLYDFLNTENYNVQNICRLCLSTNSGDLYSLASDNSENLLAHVLTALTTVQLSPNDGLPTNVCELCQTQLLQYYEFKIKCEKSDYALRSILNGEFIPKEEPPDDSLMIKEEAVNKEDMNGNKEEYHQDIQYLEEFNEDDNENHQIGQVKKVKRKKTLKRSTKAHKIRRNENAEVKKIKASKQPKLYTCSLCSKVFDKAKTFHIHLKRKHGDIVDERAHPCEHCKASFDSEHDLMVHSALHTEGRDWNCNQCHKEFNSKTTLRRHIQRHMDMKPHCCDTCGKTFTELYALRRHTRVHTGELVEKKHACHICDKRYGASGLLAAHISRHIDLRPCECQTCGKRFSSQRLLHSHMLVHTDRKPYACSYCDKRFRHESTRNTHHRTHTGEKPYVCSVCGKNFIQNSNLTLHMRTHTGERPYSCKICERKFTSGSSLKSHERIHTGERPYSCNICGKKFARMSLRAHMRQHSDDRPFACSACPKKFVNASRLRDHHRVHTGERPYQCSHCNLTFSTKSHLIKHIKSHHQPLKKNPRQELIFVQQNVGKTKNAKNTAYSKRNGGFENDNHHSETVEDIEHSITLGIVEEIPLEVNGELILQDDSDIRAELLVIENSEDNYHINNDVCLSASSIDLNSDGNFDSDVNLVAVNEGVSISASTLEGSSIKLYQLDQSLVQIQSSSGQVTISKITSKMTANF